MLLLSIINFHKISKCVFPDRNYKYFYAQIIIYSRYTRNIYRMIIPSSKNPNFEGQNKQNRKFIIPEEEIASRNALRIRSAIRDPSVYYKTRNASPRLSRIGKSIVYRYYSHVLSKTDGK